MVEQAPADRARPDGTAAAQAPTTLESVPAHEAADAERAARAALPRAFRVIDDVLKTVMVVMLVVLVVAVAANVFGRFVLNRSLASSDELSRFLFIWVIFLGAALAHLHREHIAVDLVVGRLPRSLARPVVVVQELLIGVVLVALLLSARQVFAIDSGISPLLRIPLRWIEASVPLCALVMLVITVYRIATALRRDVTAERV